MKKDKLLDLISAVVEKNKSELEERKRKEPMKKQSLMGKKDLSIREQLAINEQVGWMDLIGDLFSFGGKYNDDGTFTINAKDVDRLISQRDTSYSDLDIEGKISNLRKADMTLEIIFEFLIINNKEDVIDLIIEQDIDND